MKERRLVGKYKNGKDKYKTEDVEYDFPALLSKNPEDVGSVKTKLGYWTVDDKVLKNFGGPIPESILKLREWVSRKTPITKT